MKKLLLIALSATMVFTACKKKDSNNNTQNKARVMFVNGAIDVDSLRTSVSNTANRSVAILGHTGYISVDPVNSANLTYRFTGSGNVFQETTINLVADNSYSVFAGGSANMNAIISQTDDLSAPAAGKVKVRLVHLAAGSANAVMYIGPSAVDSNIAFGSITTFKEVNPGSQTVTVSALSSVATLSSFNFVAGKIYTLMFSGSLNGTGNSALTLTAISNN